MKNQSEYPIEMIMLPRLTRLMTGVRRIERYPDNEYVLVCSHGSEQRAVCDLGDCVNDLVIISAVQQAVRQSEDGRPLAPVSEKAGASQKGGGRQEPPNAPKLADFGGVAKLETFRHQMFEDDSLVEISRVAEKSWLVKTINPKGTVSEFQVAAD